MAFDQSAPSSLHRVMIKLPRKGQQQVHMIWISCTFFQGQCLEGQTLLKRSQGNQIFEVRIGVRKRIDDSLIDCLRKCCTLLQRLKIRA